MFTAASDLFFCYTRPPRFHEQNFPSSCKEEKDTRVKDELDAEEEATEFGETWASRLLKWHNDRDKWIEYNAHIPPSKFKLLLPTSVPKAPPPPRPDTTLIGFPDRANAARGKEFRDEFRRVWQETFPFLVIAVFTARLC